MNRKVVRQRVLQFLEESGEWMALGEIQDGYAKKYGEEIRSTLLHTVLSQLYRIDFLVKERLPSGMRYRVVTKTTVVDRETRETGSEKGEGLMDAKINCSASLPDPVFAMLLEIATGETSGMAPEKMIRSLVLHALEVFIEDAPWEDSRFYFLCGSGSRRISSSLGMTKFPRLYASMLYLEEPADGRRFPKLSSLPRVRLGSQASDSLVLRRSDFVMTAIAWFLLGLESLDPQDALVNDLMTHLETQYCLGGQTFTEMCRVVRAGMEAGRKTVSDAGNGLFVSLPDRDRRCDAVEEYIRAVRAGDIPEDSPIHLVADSLAALVQAEKARGGVAG